MEHIARVRKDLPDFEWTYLERLRLAAQVILDATPDLALVPDPLEVELQIFKERVEFLLLTPEHSDAVLPWRKLLNGEEHPSRGPQAGDSTVEP
jgi:hypothetical protein